jgi:hypothetical protein
MIHAARVSFEKTSNLPPFAVALNDQGKIRQLALPERNRSAEDISRFIETVRNTRILSTFAMVVVVWSPIDRYLQEKKRTDPLARPRASCPDFVVGVAGGNHGFAAVRHVVVQAMSKNREILAYSLRCRGNQLQSVVCLSMDEEGMAALG